MGHCAGRNCLICQTRCNRALNKRDILRTPCKLSGAAILQKSAVHAPRMRSARTLVATANPVRLA
jgi:hypothetical protein